MWRAYELLEDLAKVAATKVTLLPVGTDYTPPSRWVTDVAREWARRYAWPRFEVGLPREFFAAVRAEMAEQGRAPSPQTRDMNPVYTGKDVSFIDTKQAQRLAESTIADAETLAAFAGLLGAPLPQRELDKAWRQLVFGAHHDGITGSESDQVYLDLLGGWREAYELAEAVADRAARQVVDAIDTSGPGEAAVVFNTLGWDRGGVVTLDVPVPGTDHIAELADEAGEVLTALNEPSHLPDHVRLTFRAGTVPGTGYRTYRLHHRAAGGAGRAWADAPGLDIANEHLEVVADPARGGGLARVSDRDSGFQLIPHGEVGNELLVYPEYHEHPRFHEGPWNLLPLGPPSRSRAGEATVLKQRSALGERLVVEGALEGFRYRQFVTLWEGAHRLELRTELHGWALQDRLLRLRFPTALTGGTPVSAVGDAVVARGFGLIDVDAEKDPWTLDNPAAEWFGLSTTLVVEAAEAGTTYHQRSVGVAELVTPAGSGAAPWARALVVALVQQGVTSTCTEAAANRYGALSGDSNMPDFRIAVGGPEQNAFVAAVLAEAGPQYAAALEDQLARQGWARLLVPPTKPLREVWVPSADLRSPRALPVLVVAGRDDSATAAAVSALQADVSAGRVVVEQGRALVPDPEKVPGWTAALLNRGTPGFAVDSGGALHVSLMRSCTGWPSGVWIDPPRRHAPDGSAFELEHWGHVFDNALVLGQGDWRQAGCVEESLAYNRPLRTALSAAHPGPLPATARLFSLRATNSAGESSPNGPSSGQARPAVVIGALKPAGHPLASSDPSTGLGAAGEDASSDLEISARFYEPYGQPVAVSVESFFPVLAAHRANLLEEPGDALALSPNGTGTSGTGTSGTGAPQAEVAVAAGEIVTLRLRLAGVGGPAGGDATAGSGDRAGELAQPVFSRYWLHNKGPAPIGNQALSVHILPTALMLRSEEAVEFMAQVASGSARVTQSGQLELLAPEGWDIEPSGRMFSLSPGACLRVPVRLRPPAHCRPGRHFVAARISDHAGQVQEDVLTVDIVPALPEASHAGQAAPWEPGAVLAKAAAFGHPSAQLPAELEAVVATPSLEVAPSSSASLGVELYNRAMGELRGEVQLISPIETWPYVGPWTQGFTLAPGQRRLFSVKVTGPEHGALDSWALFKVSYFGRIFYSPSVALHLGTVPGPGQAHG
jgi:hypothetical protein